MEWKGGTSKEVQSYLSSRVTISYDRLSGQGNWCLLSASYPWKLGCENHSVNQRYTYRVLQTIQMKLILLCVWAERAVMGSAKTALKFKYEI